MAAVGSTTMASLSPHSYCDAESITDRVSSLVLGTPPILDEYSGLNVLTMVQDDETLSSESLGIFSETRLVGSLFDNILNEV